MDNEHKFSPQKRTPGGPGAKVTIVLNSFQTPISVRKPAMITIIIATPRPP